MLLRTFRFLLISASIIANTNAVRAQAGLCPPNMDLEMGNFTNWVCNAGNVAISGGVNTITWSSIGPPLVNRHTIIDLATAGIDFYGGFPEICPNGSGYSAKLGNNTASLNGGIGTEASGISYTYAIPATTTVFSLFFHYAVVLQNPNHTPEAQPRFRARVRDLTVGTNIPCVTFDFTASSSLPGFRPSPVDPGVIYKDWTPVTLNLSGLAGRTIELEFIVSECTQNGHFAYAFVDVNSNCNGAISGTTICQGDNSITLTAPYGFQSYAWYSDNTFTTILSTNQTLPLNPAPAVGTVYPVIVTPYPGFGCIDTLYATISVAPKPTSNAGPDVSICKNQQAQIGGPSGAPALNYAWTPANQVSSPIISNPIAWNTTSSPTEFIVKTTDILTGCFSYDTTYLSDIVVDTVISLNGNTSFCDYGIPGATLTVNNTSTSVQWYNNTTAIPGATSFSYQPLISGSYWAEVIQNGCTDSTGTVPISVEPIPQASFSFASDTGCVTNNSFLFTNSSTISDNSSLSYNWKFSDGTTLQTTDAVKSFSAVGSYNIELVVTSAFGCKDSTASSTVHVLPNGVPDFKWDSLCLNRPVLFTNLSNENGSPFVQYTWTFNDGGPGSTIKDPLPVTYTTSGQRDVILEMSTLGCENYPQTITKEIYVNKHDAGVRYRTITVPEGSSRFIHARDSIGSVYNWRPQQQLSSYNTRYTEFFATGNDVEYLIEITDLHTCVSTDTILMQILKKPGYYLPTAFTPNGDGLNDVARPYLVGMKSLKSFSIFNRWGNLIFYTTKEGEGWDGTFKGERQATGVYVWMLEFVTNDDKVVLEKGTITVIR